MAFFGSLAKTAVKGAGLSLGGIGGALVSGLFGLGSNLLSNRGALRRQQLADQQNIRFWEMQNAYNTPAMQMARLKKAGLNPALIYGSGATNTGVAGAVAPSKPAPYNIKNPVPLQAMMLNAQINNINAQTDKTNAETARTLGLTPHQVNKSLSDANQARHRAVLAKIESEVASEQKQDKINELAQKVLILKEQYKLEEAKATYKAGMYKLNMNPDTPVYNSIYQTIFGSTKDFIQNKLPDHISNWSGVKWNK